MRNIRAHFTEKEQNDYRAAVRELASSPEARACFLDKAEELSLDLERNADAQRRVAKSDKDTRDVLGWYLCRAAKRMDEEKRRWKARAHVVRSGTEIDVEAAKRVPFEAFFDVPGRRGSRMTMCCPFHGEKTPSFTIFADTNHGHCFGCGWHGDVIAFRMEFYEETFVDACKFLLSI